MKWTETITPKQAVEELGVPYHGWMREMDRAWVSEDGQYSVMSRLLRTPVGKVEHVAITSAAGCGKCDGSGDIPWAVKMQIKNELFGEKRAAKVSIMTQAPGAFFCYGILMAGCIWLEGKLDARIERKSCCDLDNLKKEAE